ncbi:MAG TPA: hypothetical protein DCE18_02675, partial [Syntrophobacteraceae bacterium]|nr:hypothetical protein [Syntrophobacteraceae bacterium]
MKQRVLQRHPEISNENRSRVDPPQAWRRPLPWVYVLVWFLAVSGCAHRVTNQPLPQYQPQDGYRGRNIATREKDDQILLLLT